VEEIKRYEPGISGTEYKDGRYVLFTDYTASVEARRKAEERLRCVECGDFLEDDAEIYCLKHSEIEYRRLRQQNAALDAEVDK
jgi:hypothetical protein